MIFYSNALVSLVLGCTRFEIGHIVQNTGNIESQLCGLGRRGPEMTLAVGVISY
jgi:hypothetical protein